MKNLADAVRTYRKLMPHVSVESAAQNVLLLEKMRNYKPPKESASDKKKREQMEERQNKFHLDEDTLPSFR